MHFLAQMLGIAVQGQHGHVQGAPPARGGAEQPPLTPMAKALERGMPLTTPREPHATNVVYRWHELLIVVCCLIVV